VNFIVDGMLGKLARWLRIMGHDVTYSTKLDDPALLILAKEKKPRFAYPRFCVVSKG